MFDLSKKVVLFAGGGGYLGCACCLGLVEQGAAVVVADLSEEKAGQMVEAIRGRFAEARVSAVGLDIGEPASVASAVAETLGRFGRLDIAVNATYYSPGKTVEDLTAEEFDRSCRVNVTGSFVFARESAAAMSAGGSIIMFASMYGLVAPNPRMYHPPMTPNPIDYGAGKAALIQMVRYLAVHWGPRNIRINAVAPGPFPAPPVQRDAGEFVQRLAARTALGRIGQADQIAGAVAFLAADESSYVTAATIPVDGGWTAM
ncbi:MAG: SDR family oxidoreductase [Phycisphaerae bacterium]|nr:SDR family oxidoreductase [Phycisphaerae bacterium]